MQTLGRVIVFLTLLAQFVYSAGVSASVSSNEVMEGNVAQLQIRAEGDEIEFPQISEIDGTPVVGTSIQSSRNMTYINGEMKSEKITTKIIGFVPKKDLTIPSYTVMIDGKNYQTEPISIKVVTSKAPQLKANALYSFELKSDKREVMAGESFVVNLYVSISDRIKGAKLSDFVDPLMPDFYSKALGEPKQYRQNGYTVVEKQYLLTTKSEGNFTISAATAKLGEADLRRRDFFGRYATQWYDIASNDLMIKVKPQPQKSDLIGEFTLDATVDTTEAQVNKPVNLTIKIEGKGNLEDFEFPPYEIDGVTIFSDDAKVESKVENGVLYSTYTISFAMISDKDFTIPSHSFTVYNPNTSRLETMKIASYDIKVKGDTNALVATTPPANSASKVEQSSPNAVPMEVSTKTQESQPNEWWMLVVSFGSGMLVMYLLFKFLAGTEHKKRVYGNNEALQILYPHINEDPMIEEMVRKLYARKNGDKSITIDKKVLKELIKKVQR
ncbi:BatD family protein [Sulfurovum sp. zt1-1]|uniref:BatD family protein n=1 Tax=Sulfurovum zhangzhouensis TaxID=3019067 RepID=A0ABT7QWU1_9BACT|nr:BatD family protein [Sulfurovum zhangzhouensis]MDM5271309.1 BatD family protein [Sulfurovum zhangzhouensis]